MEVIEVCERRRMQPRRPTTCPANRPHTKKCTKRYVQPARVKSFAPARTYCPPEEAIEGNTTYHLSYLNAERVHRTTPIRPTQSLETMRGKFEDVTTNKLSYQALWDVARTKPILPRRRPLLSQGGPMQSTTTVRRDYTAPATIEKPEIIMPCISIKVGSGVIDSTTTAGLSYMNPGNVQRTASFKPMVKYCPPGEPTAKDTTHKLSFQPFRVGRRETYPWAKKPSYRPPECVMDDHTTYKKSYMELCGSHTKEKPIVPRCSILLSSGDQFFDKTVYNESYLPSGEKEVVTPALPRNNIALSHDKMTADTTNKLSYQPVRADKRKPIWPRTKRLMGDGPMQSETTSRRDFVPKPMSRPSAIPPCDNIRSPENAPLEGNTTNALSYQNPGPVLPTSSFRPQRRYSRPTEKIEADTVNKLSYQTWTLGPKPSLPWRPKTEYTPPKERMTADTIYEMSYPAPGYYVEDCEYAESVQCEEPKEISCNYNQQ